MADTSHHREAIFFWHGEIGHDQRWRLDVEQVRRCRSGARP
jgi:hypothetical protein